MSKKMYSEDLHKDAMRLYEVLQYLRGYAKEMDGKEGRINRKTCAFGTAGSCWHCHKAQTCPVFQLIIFFCDCWDGDARAMSDIFEIERQAKQDAQFDALFIKEEAARINKMIAERFFPNTTQAGEGEHA